MIVDLGIVDENNDLSLESNVFPSKIGGNPAWLNLEHIPDANVLQCSICGKPTVFLCQLYCPIDDDDKTFHRTIFIFLCLTRDCFLVNSNRNFLVFRSQLPRKNKFYSYYPPDKNNTWDLKENCKAYEVYLCDVCGIKRSLNCGRCKKNFCSKYHQYLVCSCDNNLIKADDRCKFPELSLSIEPDIDSEDDASEEENSETDSNSDSEMKYHRMNDYESYIKSNANACTQDDLTVEKYFADFTLQEDKYFKKFKDEISREPNQVIRYSRDSGPLWICENNIPLSSDIPHCSYCGAERQFEFQVLPQMLSYLKLDNHENCAAGIFDWGILAVYTCKNNCDNDPAYKKEYLWKQDIL